MLQSCNCTDSISMLPLTYLTLARACNAFHVIAHALLLCVGNLCAGVLHAQVRPGDPCEDCPEPRFGSSGGWLGPVGLLQRFFGRKTAGEDY